MEGGLFPGPVVARQRRARSFNAAASARQLATATGGVAIACMYIVTLQRGSLLVLMLIRALFLPTTT